MALLQADGISKRFGGVVALSELTLAIGPDEAVGLIGPNGAGKTTLFNCLLGLEHPDAGRVTFDGTRIDNLPTFRRSRLGIGRTFQRLELFTGMTPREHIIVTDRVRARRGGLLRDLAGMGSPNPSEQKAASEILELVGLTAVADTPVEALGLGYGRLVELGRALVGSPRLLMLDEPSSGLDVSERRAFVPIMSRARVERGAAFILVEHDLELVREAVERLVVLDFGRLIADGPVEEVLADPEVRRAYTGRGAWG